MSFFSRYFRGFRFLYDGVRLALQHPKIQARVLAPFFIDLALLLAGGILGALKSWTLTQQMLASQTSLNPSTWLYYPIFAIVFGLFFVLAMFLVYLLASLLGLPFNASLARETLRTQGTSPQNGLTWRQIIQTSLKTAVLLILSGGLLILLLIPLIQVLAVFLSLLAMAFDSLDYSFAELGFSNKQRLEFLRNNKPEFLGMATAIGCTLLMPGMTLLIAPFAIVGAANLVAHLNRNPKTT